MKDSQSENQEILISVEICRFVKEFQNIEVIISPDNTTTPVSIAVHPPYMQQCVSLLEDPKKCRKLEQKHKTRLMKVKIARDTADETLKKFFNNWFYDEEGKETFFSCGRANLIEIQRFLQEAVTLGILPIDSENSNPTGKEPRDWLKKYGVGVDCSGFVQQVLQHLLEFIDPKKTTSPLENVGFLRCGWVYQDVLNSKNNSSAEFRQVKSPSTAKPGDILVNFHHIRVVVKIEHTDNGSVILDLAESTSAIDIPTGQVIEEPDIGPRMIKVKYPYPHLPISRQFPLIKRLIDSDYVGKVEEKTYLIGRHRRLEPLWVSR